MSVNNVNEYNSIGNEIFGEYKFADSSFINTTASREYSKVLKERIGLSGTASYKETYTLPLDFVRSQCYSSLAAIKDSIKDIEATLSKVFIDPNSNYDLLLAHQDIWKEVSKNISIDGEGLVAYYNAKVNKVYYSDNQEATEEVSVNYGASPEDQPVSTEVQIQQALDEIDPKDILSEEIMSTDPTIEKQNSLWTEKIPTPNYICFQQIVYAEKSATTISRRFLEEFYETIAHSTFSYIYQLRKFLMYLEDEIINIQKSLQVDYGDAYENELQQKIAVHYDAYSKTAVHYAKRVAKIFISRPGEIPATELDQVSKEQASKFQAFFAIKLNAVNSEIEDILSSIKRDTHDNSEIFYDRYLRPSLTFSSKISNPLELQFQTTSFGKKIPFLSEELVIAAVALRGNFTSIVADYIERQNIIIGKVDNFLRLIHEKRKYANFINQLSVKGAEKPKILMTVDEEYYSNIFLSISQYVQFNNKTYSDHALLSGLEQNDHPQYLLKDGGTITGDILVEENVTIDGVDLSAHAHTGTDGSPKISSLDIDYGMARSEDNVSSAVSEPVNIAISKFNIDIVNKLPVCNAVLNIEVENDTLDIYEYEIIYKEID